MEVSPYTEGMRPPYYQALGRFDRTIGGIPVPTPNRVSVGEWLNLSNNQLFGKTYVSVPLLVAGVAVTIHQKAFPGI